MTGNRELADRAQVIASRPENGITRKADLVVKVALMTTGSPKAARAALVDSDVLPDKVRADALALFDLADGAGDDQ